MGRPEVDDIRVLHVEDEQDFADLAATFLERADDRLRVETVSTAQEGREVLDERDVDCVVSDFDMPGENGVEFLEAVREEYPDLPFVLFTGKGSEEVAGEAIRKGATDYLQKATGTDQYTILANRIRNAVEQYRARQRAANLDRIRTLVSDTTRALVRAETRAGIYRQICEIISDAEPYRFAWIGEVDPETDRVHPRASAGEAEGYLDDITVTVDETATGRGPGGTAVSERRVAVQTVRDDPAFAEWRAEATERGYQAVAAVPLEYEDILYGVLGVYADRADAFDDRERELLADLGEDVGHALHRVQLREELRGREEHLAHAQAVASIASWQRDFETGELYWSDEVYRIFGIPEDVTPSHEVFLDRVHPEDRDLVEEHWRAAQAGEPYDIEHRIVVDGETKWVREKATVEFDDGEPVEGFGIVQDVTDRTELEAELEKKSSQLDTIFEELPVSLYFKDEAARHVRVSEGHATGYEGYYPPRGKGDLTIDGPEDFLGKTDLDLFSEQNARPSYEDDRRVIETGEAILRKVEHLTYGDGGERWLTTTKVPWRGTDEEIVGLLGFSLDITERKRYERRLERQNERLEEFASIVSHDLRNPLNVARGRLELLQRESDSEDNEHLAAMERAHDRMERLIADLLALARQGNTLEETQRVRLHEVVERSWSSVETAEATSVVETERSILADPDRLQQLLENLVRNAVEHGSTSPRSSSTREDAVEHGCTDVTVTVGDLDDGFYVADDGPGIPEAEREDVFERGYTTERDGTGFGLAIVERIAEAHDWSVDVTQSASGGARFEVTGIEFVDE